MKCPRCQKRMTVKSRYRVKGVRYGSDDPGTSRAVILIERLVDQAMASKKKKEKS